MLIRSKLFATAALLVAGSALAGTAFAKNGEISGQVDDVRWFSSSNKGFVKLDKNVTDASGSCTSPYAMVREADGGRQPVMRLATAALLSGKTVTLRTSGCDGKYPILTAIQLAKN